MSKPKWLKDIENGVEKPKYIYKTCSECKHFNGKPINEIKYKGKEKCMLWECAIHHGCYNTRHSVRCSDWVSDDII